MSSLPSSEPLPAPPTEHFSFSPSNDALTPPAVFVMPVFSVPVHSSATLRIPPISHSTLNPGVPFPLVLITSCVVPSEVSNSECQPRLTASITIGCSQDPEITLHFDVVHFVSSSTAPGPTDPSPESSHSHAADDPSSVSFTVPFDFVPTAPDSTPPACRHSGAMTSSFPPLVASMSSVPSSEPLPAPPTEHFSFSPSNDALTPPAVFVMPVFSVPVHSSATLRIPSISHSTLNPGVPFPLVLITSCVVPSEVSNSECQPRLTASITIGCSQDPEITLHFDVVHFVSSSTAPGPTDPSPESSHSHAPWPSSVSFTVPFDFVPTASEGTAPACRHSASIALTPRLVALFATTDPPPFVARTFTRSSYPTSLVVGV